MSWEPKLHEGVTVNDTLQGIIFHIGEVKFSSDLDWVGVKLTGTSARKGKHDGIVQGVKYFNCTPNSKEGIFVRSAACQPRELSKLEQLKLKRELQQSSASSSVVVSSPHQSRKEASPRRPTTPAITTGGLLLSSDQATVTSGVSKTSNTNRLEEIRQRRAAAAATSSRTRTPTTTSSSSTPPRSSKAPSVATSVSRGDASSTPKRSAARSDTNTELLLEEKENKINELESELTNLREKIGVLENDNLSLKRKFESTDDAKDHTISQLRDELAKAHQQSSEVDVLKEELEAAKQSVDDTQEQLKTALDDLANEAKSNRGKVSAQEVQATMSESYKETARLQGETVTLKRRIDELEKAYEESEAAMEELAVDKEALLVEKEMIEEKLEEMNLDLETQRLEIEELKADLEEAKSEKQSFSGMSSLADSLGGSATEVNADLEDVVKSLSQQNSRLREAIMRLREQANVEKMELNKSLRAAQKDAAIGKELEEEVNTLRALKTKSANEIQELKAMIDEGSAFESMVEHLSDRILSMEEDNGALLSSIQDLEHAAEIGAEIEEGLLEENKALLKDLESRNTKIRNLEEAIKVQRKREGDFAQTVGNYRKNIDTLKQEKASLLALQQGGEGDKSALISASQKALAQAAFLVNSASDMRKLEAEGIFNRIEAEIGMIAIERVENYLPKDFQPLQEELCAAKGEMVLGKVLQKCSVSLQALETNFESQIEKGVKEFLERANDPSIVSTSDETKSQIFTITEETISEVQAVAHEARFAHLVAELGSTSLKYMCASQWPNLLTMDESIELASILLPVFSDADLIISQKLRVLTQEGCLSPNQTALSDLEDIVNSSKSVIVDNPVGNDETILIPCNWSPRSWNIQRSICHAKFLSLSTASVVACAVLAESTHGGSSAFIQALSLLHTKLTNMRIEATKVSFRLTNLGFSKDALPDKLETSSVECREKCQHCFNVISNGFIKPEMNTSEVQEMVEATDAAQKALSSVILDLQSIGATENREKSLHVLFPQRSTTWKDILKFIQDTGVDEADLNVNLRGKDIKDQLMMAIESQTELSQVNARVESLQNIVSSRNKEISIQNTRMAELEQLLSQVSSESDTIRSPTKKDKNATKELSEEIRTLNEALEVMQSQVYEYEAEIRSLKDSKSSRKRQSLAASNRKSITPTKTSQLGDIESTLALLGKTEVSVADSSGTINQKQMSLEAAVFRPALHDALNEINILKQQKIKNTISSLPPLDVLPLPKLTFSAAQPQDGSDESGEQQGGCLNVDGHEAINCIEELQIANAKFCFSKASYQMVDLSKEVISRKFLQNEQSKIVEAGRRLQSVYEKVSILRHSSSLNHTAATTSSLQSKLIGKIRFGTASDATKIIPVSISRGDLNMIHSRLLQ